MKTALVLFCGTKSIDRSLEAEGFFVQSLDMDPKCNPTWCANILDWEAWRDIEPGTLDFIWASPPCTQYSRARTTAKTPRDLKSADRIVYRTLEIIAHLRPKTYLIKNPQTGMLKDRVVLSHAVFRDACYCRCSHAEKHAYRERSLRILEDGETPDLRATFLSWLSKAPTYAFRAVLHAESFVR